MSERLYLDRTIAPARAIPRRAKAWLFGALLAANLLIAVFLFAIGAFPVPLFLGLDFVGLAAAFAVIERRAGRGERVTVSADRVAVARLAPAGAATVWTSPTAFTRVEEAAAGHVRLCVSGRSLLVGAGLGEGERRRFAQALRHAIGAAREERW